MTNDQVIQLLIAVIGGGAMWETLKSVIITILNKGKTLREEMKERISELDKEIIVLRNEVRSMKVENDQLREKYEEYREKYALLRIHAQKLELSIEERGMTIAQLERKNNELVLAASCEHVDSCPFHRQGGEHATS